MRNVLFFSKAICLFLLTIVLINCSSTDINEEVGIESLKVEKENIKILDDEKDVPQQKIEKDKIKVPSQG